METLAWIAAAVVLSLLAVTVLVRTWIKRQPKPLPPLPTEWALSARPVFTAEERRAFKLLREALPHHVVLAKLPLVRFSQPSDATDVRYWYDLLGSINVTFAVCSQNGRVLAAIDLDSDRSNSRRILQIKQSVLGTCRIRYLRCSPGNLPSAAELQLLVPSGASAGSRPAPGTLPGSRDLDEARDSLATTVASRRAERSALWQDSSLFSDSFFAPDSRQDGYAGSDFAGLAAANGAALPGSSVLPNELAAGAVASKTGTPSPTKAVPIAGDRVSAYDAAFLAPERLETVIEEGGAVVEDDEPSGQAHR